MKSKSAVNIIGTDSHGCWIVSNAALFPGVVFRHWAPSPDGQDRAVVAQQAGAARIPFSSSWTALLSDPAPVILVLSNSNRRQILEEGLQSGKTLVLSPSTICDDAEIDIIRSAAAKGRGRILHGGWIGYTQAGLQAKRLIREEAFGKLHSIYLALRTKRNATTDVDIVREAGWPVFDFICSCVPGSIQSVYVSGSALFNEMLIDTAVCLIRFQAGAIVTVELSRCLPANFAAADSGEVEFEIIGANKTLRSEPNKSAVILHGEAAVAALPWNESPLLEMLTDACRAPEQATIGLPHLEKVTELMAMAGRSLNDGLPVRRSSSPRNPTGSYCERRL